MIDADAWLHREGFGGEPEPGRGKHAVIPEGFFAGVDALQAGRMPAEWRWRPLVLEFEITSACNQSCPSCGMAAGTPGAPGIPKIPGTPGIPETPSGGLSMPEEILDRVAEGVESLGIPGVSITGGEPLLDIGALCDAVSRLTKTASISKVATNGWWLGRADAVMDRLEEAGLFAGRWFTPTLMISIGEQSTPLSVVADGLDRLVRRYGRTDLTICLSSLSQRGGADPSEALARAFEERHGAFPHDRVMLTRRFYVQAGRADAPAKRDVPMAKLLKDKHCFERTVGAHVVPRPLVKASGKTFACAVFNVPERLSIGDLAREDLRAAFARANADPAIRRIQEKGFGSFAAEVDPGELAGARADNFHEACGWLLERAAGAAGRGDEGEGGGGGRCGDCPTAH